MTAIAEDVIRSLAAFKGEHAPVTSCYLDVDGRRLHRHQDLEQEVEALLRGARAKANGHNPSVTTDLRRIEDYVRAGFDRSHTRGLAIFACSAHDLWEVIPLPVPVQNRVVINHFPAVSQLEALFEESAALAVLLADRQRARLFVFELGELTDRSELFDELPRDYDTTGQRDQGDVVHHVEELRHVHLRHAAEVAWRVYQDHGFEHLAVAASDDIAGELEGLLHPYLRQRLCDRLHLPVGAAMGEVRAAAIEVETKVERRKEAAVVQRLREAVATGRRGVAGLGPVLEALRDRRVERLLVSQGYSEPGWRCEPCGGLAEVGRTCPSCTAQMEEVDDVVEEAVEAALSQSARVEICVGNADLDVLGRVGALLRY
ncbi:MAG: peptide chain release factor subunit 1 [Acidimicrobiaceae bacterium]